MTSDEAASPRSAEAASPLMTQLTASHEAAAAAVGESVRDHAASLGRILQLDLDLQAWESRLVDRPECRQLTDARRELGFAIYAASSGLYVHAYAGLRLFLELSFASVFFSANELLRRRWVADRADFSWSKALDENDGVLAPKFVKEFSASAAEHSGNYARLAARAYRHCSQFIHGKLAVTDLLPQQLSDSQPVMADWLSHARDSTEAVLYLVYARYGDELIDFDHSSRLIETLDPFMHLSHVRRRFGLPVEDEGRAS